MLIGKREKCNAQKIAIVSKGKWEVINQVYLSFPFQTGNSKYFKVSNYIDQFDRRIKLRYEIDLCINILTQEKQQRG